MEQPKYYLFGLCLVVLVSCAQEIKTEETLTTDPLPSWVDGASKGEILAFVKAASSPGNAGFIEPSNRIATFDNDGTLWSEQPMYFQLFFALDRVKTMAPEHPEWQEDSLMIAVMNDDMETIMQSGMKGLMKIIMTSHAGMTTEEFETIVSGWLATAKHPSTGKAYTEMVYQPMLELLDHLRANEFKVFIVSGGGIEFMRPWVELVYGIPKDQVVGSSIKVELTEKDGSPVLMRLPEIDFIDDKEGKPVGIHKFIGKRPVMAFGNSDGDLQMLQWTEAGNAPNMMVYIHHTDSVREWAYDRNSHIGKLDKGLDIAQTNGWTVVDMEKDWGLIYPYELGTE